MKANILRVVKEYKHLLRDSPFLGHSHLTLVTPVVLMNLAYWEILVCIIAGADDEKAPKETLYRLIYQ